MRRETTAVQSSTLDIKIEPQKEWNMPTKGSISVTKDPICGMTVDPATALHAERDGKTFYFCSDSCKQKFMSTPAGAKPKGKSGGCCG